MDSHPSAPVPQNSAFTSDGFDRPGPFTTARSADADYWPKANLPHVLSDILELIDVDRPSSSQHPSRARSKKKASSSSSKPSHPPKNHIPRPRNAFMIFRSAVWAEKKINRNVEHDHRHISRIAGHCWNRMSELERDKWRAKAAMEKDEHARKHPDYVFSRTPRANQPVRRNVKRSGPTDLKRCEKVADLFLMGKQGDDLAEAIKAIKLPTFDSDGFPTSPESHTSHSTINGWSRPDLEDPPFRSPLLPPSSIQSSPSDTPIMLSRAELLSTATVYLRQKDIPCINPEFSSSDADFQPYKSALFQIPSGSSPANSAYSVEGLNQYFTHNANSFDTLDSVGYPTARSPTPAPDYYGSPQLLTACDASATPHIPNPESIYGFHILPRRARSPSPMIDEFISSTRLPNVDGTTVEELPRPERPARVTEEPLVFRNPFSSAES